MFFDKLELDNYIHPDLQGYSRVLAKLNIHPLDESTFNLRLVEQYYLVEKLNNADRFRLLEYVRDTYFQIGNTEFQGTVKNTPLIYCHDERYRRASEVYFASPLLDDVFSDGYHHPNSNYELPVADADDKDMRPYVRNEWYRFFDKIGIREEPDPSDVIARIDTLVATKPQKANTEAIVRIIRYLDGLASEIPKEYAELAHRTWLPADDNNWHTPSDIYQRKHVPLIGQQRPILAVSISSRLIQLLGIPERPDADLVVRHLLHSAEQKQPIEDGKVYAYLGKYWDKASGQYRSRLKSEAIIWDSTNKRYWKPDLCFIGNEQGRYFSTYRHYRKSDNEHIGQFYRHVGIRETASPEQRLTFLRHLANIGAGTPLTGDNRALLKANLDHIGEHLDKHSGILPDVQKIRVIPNEEGTLHRSDSTIVLDDQPGLREIFNNTELKFVHKEFYVEQINRFWDAIKVPRLSAAKLRIVDIIGKRDDEQHKREFVERIRHLRRVVNDKCGTTDLPFNLNELTVYTCDSLQVSYTLLGSESNPSSKLVAFDHDTNEFFYVTDASHIQLASQLVNVLQLRDVIDPSTIEAILGRRLAEIDAYLDECGYKSLPDRSVPAVPAEIHDQPLVGTGVFGEDEDDYAGNVPDSHQNAPYERPVHHDDEFEDWSAPSHTGTGFGLTGFRSSLHSSHYPNLLSELVDRFDVEQEFPEPPPPELINLEEEEISSIKDDLDFDGDDDWIPDDWADLFDNAPDDYESHLDRFFVRSRPAQVFADVQQLRRELPKPEDRRGVFQLICEAFPEDGAVLHLQDIRSSVWSRRPGIAEGTISSILSRAFPCFEARGSGSWTFNAKHILEGYANMNAAVSAYNRWGSKRRNHCQSPPWNVPPINGQSVPP